MPQSIVVVGYGPGISNSVAEKFGQEGFAVALVGRTQARLDAGAQALAAKGVKAVGISADASNPETLTAAIQAARTQLGPVAVVLWNAYSNPAGDVTTAPLADVRAIVDVPIVGLVAALQAALPDLEAAKGSFLVTNGGLAFSDPGIDQASVAGHTMGLAIGNAAKRKLVGVLHAKLAPRGVYVGEVVVKGLVKGTAFDRGQATLEPKDIAEAFWKLHTARNTSSVGVPA